MPKGKGIGKRCPECHGPSRVHYSEDWEEEDMIIRHRVCKKCGHRWETMECDFKGELKRMLKKEK